MILSPIWQQKLMKNRFKNEVGKISLKNAFKMPFKSAKKRKRPPKATPQPLNPPFPNPAFCQPPLTTPLCFATATLKRLKSAFRHPPHLAGVLNSARTPAHTPEEVYLLPPPPLASAIPPTRPTDCAVTAHGLPMAVRGFLLCALLISPWASSDVVFQCKYLSSASCTANCLQILFLSLCKCSERRNSSDFH